MTLHLAGGLPLLLGVAALLAASAALILLRLWRGPAPADRVVAIDAFTLLGVAALVLLALWQTEAVLLDVALLLALMSFIGSAAFALLLRRHDRESEP